MKKKCMFILITTALLSMQLLGQSIASVPFRGDGLNDDEREYLASVFVGPFTSLGYTFVSRTGTQKIVSSELIYQQSGSTSDAAEIGKQLKADWVLAGSLIKVFGKYKMSVAIIDVKTARILGSDARDVEGMESIDGAKLITDMASKIDAQIKREEYSILEKEEEDSIAQMQKDYENAKTLKWVGRGLWIGGLTMSLTTIFVDAGLSSEAFHFMTASPTYETRTPIMDAFGNNVGTRTTTTGIYTKSDITTLQTFFWTGLGLALIGAGMDIGFSLAETRLENNLSIAFSPYLIPQQNGYMGIGYNFSFAYKF